MIRYRECQRNHAAHLGSRVVDGCGEFMPAGDEGTPRSLRCAACDCHRSFHRREVEGDTTPTSAAATQPPLLLHTTAATDSRYISFNNSHSHHHHRRGEVMVAFGGGGGGGGAGVESSSDDQLNEYQQQQVERQQRSRKRFRTKFTQDDKDKMTALAERIGWRMQKEEEEQVQRLCSEIGIKRKVFKVWMHNNKHTNSKSKLP